LRGFGKAKQSAGYLKNKFVVWFDARWTFVLLRSVCFLAESLARIPYRHCAALEKQSNLSAI
jgi:hypothetical protein